MISRLGASSGMAVLFLAACHMPEPRRTATIAAQEQSRRAILVAYDSFNESRVRGTSGDRALRWQGDSPSSTTLDADSIPAITRLFRGAACAASARPAFPSVTSPGLASLWTGAYGDVNGISANSQPVLPRESHTLLETTSGYLVTGLRAEPMWISAGADGITVTAHHVTQAPLPPEYRAVTGERDARLEAARARATEVLARAGVSVVNGYNHRPISDTIITEESARPTPARGWTGTGHLQATLPLLEISWKSGPDSLFALLLGDRAYSRMLIASARDASRGVMVTAAAVNRSPPVANKLAAHFSDALELPRGDDPPVFARFRLFDLAADGSSYLLFQPAVHVVDMNRPDVRESYARAVRGWVGNGAGALYERGGFGPTLEQGGNGEAEAMYLESLENVTARYIEGSNWAWQQTRPALMIDYFPLADEIDHRFLGYLDPAWPGHDPALARRYASVRQSAWHLVDFHLANLQRLTAQDPRTALFVSGDHGMRASWRIFSPNIALEQAGLLALDGAGHIDLARTRALSPNGYWVMVNGTDWKEGIVPPDERRAVIDAAERALRAARSEDGSPVVTRTWRTTDHDSLGLGGPVGGDLYYEVARGYRWDAAVEGPVVRNAPVTAGHGFPSTSPEMHTVLCAAGPGFTAMRGPVARTIDVAPTVADWLGVTPPRDARGRSVLRELTRQDP